MHARPLGHRLIALALVLTIAFFSTSCGTILYPERRGQTRGVIDPGVLLLDAVGLIFFVIPGIVAFAVDFSTGAIYYPSEIYQSLSIKPFADAPPVTAPKAAEGPGDSLGAPGLFGGGQDDDMGD